MRLASLLVALALLAPSVAAAPTWRPVPCRAAAGTVDGKPAALLELLPREDLVCRCVLTAEGPACECADVI